MPDEAVLHLHRRLDDVVAASDVAIKSFESFEIKNEATGEIEAIIATLDVVDKDREVITAEAVNWQVQKAKMSSYGHDIVGGMFGGSAMPVGKGAVSVEGNKAVFRGNVFLTTERGRETLSVLKEMGKDQEWSFGFRVLGSEVPDEAWAKKGAVKILTKLDIFEVSPVLIGAGVGTRTVAAKALGPSPEEVAAAEKKAADDAAAIETKRLADEAEQKVRVAEVMKEHERIQRYLRKVGVV